jgi:hypothetical protein
MEKLNITNIPNTTNISDLCYQLKLFLNYKLTKEYPIIDQTNINYFIRLFDNIYKTYTQTYPSNITLIDQIISIDKDLFYHIEQSFDKNNMEQFIITNLIYSQIEIFNKIFCDNQTESQSSVEVEQSSVDAKNPEILLTICDLYSITHGKSDTRPIINQEIIALKASKKYIKKWDEICSLIKKIDDTFKKIMIDHRCAEFYRDFHRLIIFKLEKQQYHYDLTIDLINALFERIYKYINDRLDIKNISDTKVDQHQTNLDKIEQFKKQFIQIRKSTIILSEEEKKADKEYLKTKYQIGGSSDNIIIYKYIYKSYKYLCEIINQHSLI